MNIYIIKVTLLSLLILTVSMNETFSQTKAGEGFYLVVHHIPSECKAKIDGFYRVSKDSKISLHFMNTEIDSQKDIEVLREHLRVAILRYCRQELPKVDAFPELVFITDAEIKRAVDGVMIVGQVRKPSLMPLREGLTPFAAVVQGAGGPNDFSTIRNIDVLRDNKIITCNTMKGEASRFLLKLGDVIIVRRKCRASESSYSFQ